MKTTRQAIVQILRERSESLLSDRGVDEKLAGQVADEILQSVKPKIVVEIAGGVCNDVYATSPVDVTVRDFDNIKSGDKDPLDGANLAKSTEYAEVD
jgi:hypothetical protein